MPYSRAAGAELNQVRDFARQRITAAQGALQGHGTPSDEKVHFARKQLKRARAAVRLLRDAVRKPVYARENTALRDAARPLSRARDAKVMLETLEGLRGRGKAGGRAGVRELRQVLEDERRMLRREILGMPGKRRRIVGNLAAAVQRMGRWPVRGDDWPVLRSGIERIYRRGRKALAEVESHRSVENLHEFRKQVKYLGLALETLHAINAHAVAPLAKRAELIADRLGEDHDLAVLLEKITSLSPALKFSAALPPEIEQRRKKLARKALKGGRRLFKRTAREFSKRYF